MPLSPRTSFDDPIGELRPWVDDNLTEQPPVEAMAARSDPSGRHFARTFRDRADRTPVDCLEAIRAEAARAEAARRLPEESALTLPDIAAAGGLGSVKAPRTGPSAAAQGLS